MRTILVAAWALALSFSGCGGPEGEASDPLGRIRVQNGSEIQRRIVLRDRDVPIVPTRKSLTLAGTSSVSFREVAEVLPPTVGGDVLQATSVRIEGGLAFISYALAGPTHRGAIDVIDISDSAAPVLLSQASFPDADVNAITFFQDAVYLAVAGEALGIGETAAVERIELSPAGAILPLSSVRTGLASFVATGVHAEGGAVYATSGDSGGVYRLDPTTLAITASIATPGARWVDLDGGRIAVHEDGRLGLYEAATLTATGSFSFSSAGDQDAKSMVRFEGDKAFVTAGTEGVRVLSARTGSVLRTLALTTVDAVAPVNVVANAVALSGSWVFVAQGGAGVSVSKSDSAFAATSSEVIDGMAELGVLGLDDLESANHVEVDNDHLFVASGNGGTKILRLRDSNSFDDVSVESGFSEMTQTDFRPSGTFWADFDLDGDLDVVALGSSRLRQFTNQAGVLTEVNVRSGRRRDACMADLDNDGDMDLYHEDSVFFQNGGGLLVGFGARGLTSPNNEEGIACIDVDDDGWSDVVIFSEAGAYVGFNEAMSSLSLLETNGATLGLSGGNGNMVATADVDGDGLQDILWDDNLGGLLFIADGMGGFTQDNRGILLRSYETNGFTFGDYDNDGDMDLFYPTDASSPSHLFRNDGMVFVDTATAAGLSDEEFLRTGAFGDYDNDGDLDLYVGCDECPNIMYLNDGDGSFTLSTPAGADVGGKTQDVTFVDYDLDGDLDLALLQEDESNILLRNNLDSDRFLLVRAVGRGAGGTNRAGVGVRIRLLNATGQTLLGMREQLIQKGPSNEPAWVHFGGVDGDETYVVQADFRTGTVTATITPNMVSSTIGGNTVSKLLTISEP